MIIRAKTKTLFQGKPLTETQQNNSLLNLEEIDNCATALESSPRRLVFELTNACNLNCLMCGRNSSDFKQTKLDLNTFRWFEPLFDKIEEVTLMGWGEPTIHPDFIEMLKIIDKHSARKYFCTNGMTLDKIRDALFDYHVDVFAVSLDGATAETNNRIRRGSDIEKITKSLSEIVKIKKERNLSYPYINFVFVAMKSNIEELPKLVELAGKIGIEEVKVVYLTAFDKEMEKEVLYNEQSLVKRVFKEAELTGDKLGVILKLPHIQGEDVAGMNSHKPCYVAWRDFFIGSDGYVRPCMSTPKKFFKFDEKSKFETMWNSKEFGDFREKINDENEMDSACKRCYQSSHCNWNKKETFIQVDEAFAPKWED